MFTYLVLTGKSDFLSDSAVQKTLNIWVFFSQVLLLCASIPQPNKQPYISATNISVFPINAPLKHLQIWQWHK